MSGLEADQPPAFMLTFQHPPRMLISPAMIPRYFEADTGDEFDIENTKRVSALSDLAAVTERYGQTAIPAGLSDDPSERARQLHEMARMIGGSEMRVRDIRGSVPGPSRTAASPSLGRIFSACGIHHFT